MAKSRNVYRGGSRARDFDLFKGSPIQPWMIGPQLIRATAISDAQIRSEYSRLRSIANKRIQRMEGKPEAQETYSRHSGGFPKVSGMSRSYLVFALDEVTHFLTAERGSLSGIREKYRQIVLKLDKEKDQKIISKLEEQDSMTAYVRELINEDLKHGEKQERL